MKCSARRLGRVGCFVIAGLCAGGIPSPSAYACKCVLPPPPAHDRVIRSERALRGIVTAVENEPIQEEDCGGSVEIFQRVTIQVLAVWKGLVEPTIELEHTVGSLSLLFRVGDEWILFLPGASACSATKAGWSDFGTDLAALGKPCAAGVDEIDANLGEECPGVIFPEAQIALDRVSGVDPFRVEADGSVSIVEDGHTLTQYAWDFGDGQVAEGAVVEHVYESPGRHQLRLTVTDDRGLRSVASATIDVLFRSSPIPPWSVADIGPNPFLTFPVLAGAARREEDGHLRVFSGVGRIARREDRFFFVYQKVTGDVVLTARFSESIPVDRQLTAGLMLRADTGAGSAHGAQLLTPRDDGGREIQFVRRAMDDVASSSNVTPGVASWLRLERRGGRLTGFSSADGVSWSLLRTFEADLPRDLLAGVATTAPLERDRPSGEVDVFSLEVVSEATQFVRGDCDGDGKAAVGTVSEAVFLLGFSFLGGPRPSCRAACDADGDGAVIGVMDAIYLLSHTFLGAPPPPGPFPSCGGGGPLDVALGCAASGCAGD